MSVSSVALSSLTTAQAPPQSTETQSAAAKDGGVASSPAADEQVPQKAALPTNVGQVIDISA